MSNFLITSLIGSVILTVLLNLLPAIFPRQAERMEERMVKKMQDILDDRVNPNTPQVRVFFPWKAMLIGSIVLTILVNVVGLFAR